MSGKKTVNTALAWADSMVHEGAGYSVRVVLKHGLRASGKVMRWSDGVLVLVPENTEMNLLYIDSKQVMTIQILW